MASLTKLPTRLHFLFIFCVLSCLAQHSNGSHGNNNMKIKGMFVFGSSLVDNGNNNFLQNSVAKADYLPYGVDFPYGPSGRFTNGKNVIDLLGDRLKLPRVPVFSDPSTKGSRIIHGVNFASGGSGILDDTGSIAGNVISLNQQIKSFEEVTLPDLEDQLGSKSKNILSKYLFVVGSGGNDYTLNYFSSRLIASNISLEAFTSNLTNSLSSQIKELYRFGGRKFVLMSVNPLGSIPMVLMNNSTRAGSRGLNKAAQLFNVQLKSLVNILKQEMSDSVLIFVNSYKIIRDIIRNPVSKGFRDTTNACCEVLSRREGGNGILCKKDGKLCEDRRAHVYFDGLHPTEAVNARIATKAYGSRRRSEAYPINVKQLAQL